MMGQRVSRLTMAPDHKRNNLFKPDMYDLEDMIRDWILNEFHQTPHSKKKKKKKSERPLTENLQMCVDYNGLIIEHSLPVYDVEQDDCSHNDPVTVVEVDKSTFNNDTCNAQEHHFSTHGRRCYSYTYSLDRYLKVGDCTQVVIKLPDQVRMDNVTDDDDITITNTNDKTTIDFQQSLKMQHDIKVPSYTRLTAKLLVFEVSLFATFEIRSKLSGTVEVVLKDEKFEEVGKYTANVAEVVRHSLYTKSIPKKFGVEPPDFAVVPRIPATGIWGPLEWDVKDNTVWFLSNGSCQFRYAKERRVDTEGEQINPVLDTLKKVKSGISGLMDKKSK